MMLPRRLVSPSRLVPVLVGLGIAACTSDPRKDDPPRPDTSDTGTSHPPDSGDTASPGVVLADELEVLTEEDGGALLRVEDGGATLVFSALPPSIAALQEGDLLASPPVPLLPGGLLVRVGTVSVADGETHLSVTPAPLTDALRTGTLRLEAPFSGATLVSAEPLLEGVVLGGAARPRLPRPGVEADLVADLPPVLLHDADGNPETTDDQVILGTSLVFGAALDLDLSVDDGAIESFDLTGRATLEATTSLQATWPDASWEGGTDLAKYTFSSVVVWAGALPIVIVPVGTAYVGAVVETDLGVTLEATATLEADAGVHYAGGDWSTDADAGWDASATLTPSLAAEGRAAVGVRTTLLLYGLAGPELDGAIYGRARVATDTEPCWTVSVGHAVYARLNLDNLCSEWTGDTERLLLEEETPLAESEEVPSTWYPDLDEDGSGDDTFGLFSCWAPDGWTLTAGDCDDGDAAVGPGQPESCNERDDDCDGLTDDEDDGVTDASAWWPDVDGDGYSPATGAVTACDAPAGTVEIPAGFDCDDTQATVHAGRVESGTDCGNGVDDDCDGLADGADDGCAAETCTGAVDDDDDGLVDCEDPDCATDVACGLPEICDDGLDNDLDGATDCDDPDCAADLDCLLSAAPAGEVALADATAVVDGDTAAQNVLPLWENVSSDVSGDGLDDFAVVAFDGTSDPSSAYVFFGPRPLAEGSVTPSEADVAFVSAVGNSLSPYWLGDVDGDGVDDLALQDADCGDVADCTGSLALFPGPLGGGTLDVPDASARLLGSADVPVGDFAACPDCDGDGMAHLVVGSPYDDGGATDAGAVWLWEGGPALLAAGETRLDGLPPALTLLGDQEWSLAGSSVAVLGDVDGDGLQDLGVGARGWNREGGDNEGAVYLVTDRPAGTLSLADADAILTGSADGDLLEYAQGVGDVDGDGRDDFSVGTWENEMGGASAGAGWVFTTPPTGWVDAAEAPIALYGEAGDRVSWFLALGDVDGDGFADLGNNADVLPLLFYGPTAGGTLAPSDADATFPVDASLSSSETWSGYPVAVGDLDGDGFFEVSATFSHSASPSAGESFESLTFLFRGGPWPGAGDGTCDDGDDDDADGALDAADADCDARLASEWPAVESTCDDTLDDDADGLVDCADPNCLRDPACLPVCSNTLDDDADGWSDLDDPGCADADDADEGGFDATWECNDGLDDDGDGFIDAEDPDCLAATGPEEDADLDGWGPPGDCDDTDASIHPLAVEVPGDGLDQDCDGVGGAGPGTSVDALAPGDLVVTEILQNPNVTSDALGEWFEVWNASGVTVDLDGLVVHDLASDGVTPDTTFTVTGSLVVAADAYVLFCLSDDSTQNGGVSADQVFSSVSLGNGADEIVLRNASGVLDQVVWDGGPLFPDPTGASMSLDPEWQTATDNDDGSHWCEATPPFGEGDLGTPGAANGGC